MALLLATTLAGLATTWVPLAPVLGVPAVAVAVKVAAVRPVTVAVRVLLPASVPRVQLPTAAKPLLSVATLVAPVTLPPPVATAKLTMTPETGLLYESLTTTVGAVVTAVPAVADCALPVLTATLLAAPVVRVMAVVLVNAVPPTLGVMVTLPAVWPAV